jgi:hypothetical protein
MEEIATRKFKLIDQINFAKFSGDFNPIHIDPIESRKTLFGRVIVHGTNAVFWALDEIISAKGFVFDKIKIRFIKPIFLEEDAVCYWIENNNLILIKCHDVVVISIAVCINNTLIKKNIELRFDKNHKKSISKTFLECLKLGKQKFILRGDINFGFNLYPNFFSSYGTVVSAELAGISQVIGMECPGLNSLFASINLEIGPKDYSSLKMIYEVGGDRRFKLLNITFYGYAISATAKVFYRPTPVEYVPMTKIKNYIYKDEFKKASALIIGGSRGLGSQVARIIAVGGGKSIITYNQGRKEAYELAKQIRNFGGECEVMQFNVELNTELPCSFNQLYYFATPKIQSDEYNKDNDSSYFFYKKFYVDAFNRICNNPRIIKLMPSIFYPSTIYADTSNHEFKTYSLAKIQGEKLVDQLVEELGIDIFVKRLPRFKTDQNLRIIEEEFEDEFLHLIPIVRNMCK